MTAARLHLQAGRWGHTREGPKTVGGPIAKTFLDPRKPLSGLTLRGWPRRAANISGGPHGANVANALKHGAARDIFHRVVERPRILMAVHLEVEVCPSGHRFWRIEWP